MTYTVYTQRRTNAGYITSVKRKSVSREVALEIKAQCMANPNRQCKYIVVADSRAEEYLAEIDRRNALIEEEKNSRWAIIDEMNKKGYHTRDTIAFLNKDLKTQAI